MLNAVHPSVSPYCVGAPAMFFRVAACPRVLVCARSKPLHLVQRYLGTRGAQRNYFHSHFSWFWFSPNSYVMWMRHASQWLKNTRAAAATSREAARASRWVVFYPYTDHVMLRAAQAKRFQGHVEEWGKEYIIFVFYFICGRLWNSQLVHYFYCIKWLFNNA